MQSLRRTQPEQLKCCLKTRELDGKNSQKEEASGVCSVAGAGATGLRGHASIQFLTAVYRRFLAFLKQHFRCSVRVLRRDSIPGGVWCASYELIEDLFDSS